MNKNFKHFEIAVFVTSLFCIIAILVMIGFILKRDSENLKNQKLDVVFDNSDILFIENKLPISNSIAKNYEGYGMEENIEGYSKFSVTNPLDRKITYEIYLTEQNTDMKSIKTNYINFYLTDDKNNPYSGFDKNKMVSFYDLYPLKDKPGSKLLYRSTLMGHKTAKFKLRMWLADSYGLTQNKESFSVDIDVRIK